MFNAPFMSLETNRSVGTSHRRPRKGWLLLDLLATSCNTESFWHDTLDDRNSGVTMVGSRVAHSLNARVVGTESSLGPPGANLADPKAVTTLQPGTFSLVAFSTLLKNLANVLF